MSKQIHNTFSHYQIQTNSSSNTEITENIPLTVASGKIPPASSFFVGGVDIPLQIPTKTIRSDFDSQSNPLKPEKTASTISLSATTGQQFQIENLQLYHLFKLMDLMEFSKRNPFFIACCWFF